MPTRFVGGYPVAGGRIKGLTFEQRVQQGMAGYAPGYDSSGSLPPAATYAGNSPPMQPGDPLYFGGNPFVDVPTMPSNLRANPFTGPADFPTDLPGSATLPPAASTPPPTGEPSVGGTDIRDFGGNTSLGGDLPYSPGPGYNYYDAGNGLTYVYDSDWNYLYSNNAPTPTPSNPQNTSSLATSNPFSGSTSNGFNGSPGAAPTSPWYTAGPFPGGNQNPKNPGYVAPGVGPQNVTGQSGWEGTGASTGFLLGHQQI